jgi:hypothetical protein
MHTEADEQRNLSLLRARIGSTQGSTAPRPDRHGWDQVTELMAVGAPGHGQGTGTGVSGSLTIHSTKQSAPTKVEMSADTFAPSRVPPTSERYRRACA